MCQEVDFQNKALILKIFLLSWLLSAMHVTSINQHISIAFIDNAFNDIFQSLQVNLIPNLTRNYEN